MKQSNFKAILDETKFAEIRSKIVRRFLLIRDSFDHRPKRKNMCPILTGLGPHSKDYITMGTRSFENTWV